MNKTFVIFLLFILTNLGFVALVKAQATSAVPADKPQPRATSSISGLVVDDKGPVAGATVRVQLTELMTTTSADGAFILQDISLSAPVTLTASAPGYYIGWARARPNQPVQIKLSPHYTTDNVEYNWFEQDGVKGSAACGECHQAYAEWQADAHSQSATNIRFTTLYAGTDIKGNRSPLTKYDWEKGVAAPPDPHEAYYGPGYKLDNPDRSGNCAACHAPVAGKIPTNNGCGWSGCHTSTTAQKSEFVPDGVTPLHLTGLAAEGISCEFCHKIANVQINRKTGKPYEDSPGILSLLLLRPKAGDDLFFGPFDDVVRTDLETARDAHLPLQSESKFCAGCHYGVMGGVVANMAVTGGVLVYSSFSEWLESPYSNPKTGKSCQDCHMAPTGRDHFAFPEKGGQRRDPQQMRGHQMLNASDLASLQNAVTMTATTQTKAGHLFVDVQIYNDKTGHHVPTDSPLRHVLLVVTARDAQGQSLPLTKGPTLPDWAGNYANQPGKAFAKLLRDTWTGEMPTAAIWRPIEVVADTRLAALATDRSRYAFRLPAGAPATVEVRLIYRRAYQQLMTWKGWDDPDVVMAHATVKIGTH